MKITRFMKMKRFGGDPVDILLEQSHNPLKRTFHVEHPTPEHTIQVLAEFKAPLDTEKAQREP
jgi:proteasome activator subunit 4